MHVAEVVEVTPEMVGHGFHDGITPNKHDDQNEWWSVYVFHQLHCVVSVSFARVWTGVRWD